MIFVGDIALPYNKSISIHNCPIKVRNSNWFGNLEGSLVDNSFNKYTNTSGVYNHVGAVKELIKEFNFIGFALANNHSFDFGDVENAKKQLQKLSLNYCGIGSNLVEAAKPLKVKENGVEIIILNFGWEVIQCKIASEHKGGVNPLIEKHVLNSIIGTISENPNSKVIPFMHWSYELEAEPQPFERQLAKKMIDIGASGVLGTHTHNIGGFEVYRGKPIIYSLGNWLFKQNTYFNGNHSFPEFCDLEVAFEWDFSKNDFLFHFFNYDRIKSELHFLRTEDKNSATMKARTPFANFSEEEYRIWYKKNHYHKNKGLPIYYPDDNYIIIWIKNKWNQIRDLLIKAILNKGK